VLLLGEYLNRSISRPLHAKGQKPEALVKQSYERGAEGFRSPGMPTIPFLPPRSGADCSRDEYVDCRPQHAQNTCPFDVSGHPALTVPCGTDQGPADRHDASGQPFRRVLDHPGFGGVRWTTNWTKR
jgi:amidase